MALTALLCFLLLSHFVSCINPSHNVTRLYTPRRQLCLLEDTSNASCADKDPPVKRCSQFREEADCNSGWTWIYCRQPVVAECYWENGRCTSVSERQSVFATPSCGNQYDPTGCEQHFSYEEPTAFGTRCYWDGDAQKCMGDMSVQEQLRFDDFEGLNPRICEEQPHVELRFGICNASQISTDHECLASIPMDDANKGVVVNTLYYNALDMLGLSQYIYEYAAMRDEAWHARNYTLLQELMTLPQPLAEVAEILKTNLHLIKKKHKALDTAIATMDEYLSDNSDRHISKETKRAGRTLEVFADSPFHVNRSMVYAILKSEKKMRVEVIFRGSSTGYDWLKNMRVRLKKVKNPVKEMNETLPQIKVHSGFAKILIGDGYSAEHPMDEIIDQVIPLMRNGYRLFVSGHSLGGALATLFGFYAANSWEISKYGGGPVTVYSYESPRVGGGSFRRAFKFLEQRGKLRHARFHVQGDKVPEIPIGRYKHVGIHVHLMNRAPHRLDYPITKTWRQTGEGLWKGLISLPKLLHNHRNEEVLRRLKWAKPDLVNTSLGTEYRVMWGLQPSPNITSYDDQIFWFREKVYNLTSTVFARFS